MSSLPLRDAVEIAARVAANAGASGVEVYGVRYRRVSVAASWKGIENLLRNDEAGIGIRVHMGRRIAFMYTNRLTLNEVASVAEKAVKLARVSPLDPNFPGFYDGDSSTRLEGLYSPTIRQKIEDPVDLVETVAETVKEASQDKRVKLTMVFAGIGEAEHVILNSEGVYAVAPTTYARAMIDLVASDGVYTSPSIYEYDGSRLNVPDVRSLASHAIERALKSMKRVKIDLPEKMMVIMRPQGFIELFDYTYGAALSGKNYVNRSSPFRGKMGERIAPSCITVYDDPLIPGKMGSLPFDGEGATVRRKVVVEKGYLRTFLYNHYYASIAGTETTGNASRSSYTGTPGIAWTNIVMEPGDFSLDELMGEGGFILVDRIQGVFNAKYSTGDYGGVGSPAWLVERGGETVPLGVVSVSGNIYRDLMEKCIVTKELYEGPSCRIPWIGFPAKVAPI